MAEKKVSTVRKVQFVYRMRNAAGRLVEAEAQVVRLAKKVADKLNKEIERGHAVRPFLIALLFAVCLDLIVFAEEGVVAIFQLLPVAGQAIGLLLDLGLMPFIKIFLSIVLYLLMRKNGFFIQRKLKIFYWVLCLIKIVPVIDVLPWETITVLYTWHKVKERAAKAKAQLDQVYALSQARLEALDSNIAVVDSLPTIDQVSDRVRLINNNSASQNKEYNRSNGSTNSLRQNDRDRKIAEQRALLARKNERTNQQMAA